MVHPCPRQNVIQRMLKKCGRSWPSDTFSHRRQDDLPAENSVSNQPRFRERSHALAQAPAPVHPVSRARAARFGIAINHRNSISVQSATCSPSRIRWLLRSIPEPVEYSQYTMPPASRADCLKHLKLNVCFPCGENNYLYFNQKLTNCKGEPGLIDIAFSDTASLTGELQSPTRTGPVRIFGHSVSLFPVVRAEKWTRPRTLQLF